MKVEDRCCKSKARQRWAMIYLDPKGLRLLSFPLCFCQPRRRDKRDLVVVVKGREAEGVHKMEKGRRRDFRGVKSVLSVL